MRFQWLQSFTAKKSELKLAGVVAMLASLTTVIIGMSNFSNPDEATAIPSQVTQLIPEIVAQHAPAAPPQPVTIIPPATTKPSPVKELRPQHTEQIKPSVPNIKKSAQSNIGKGHFYIQVGAYQQKKLARLMLQKMKHTYKYAILVAKPNIHAVWVGPVATRQKANSLLQQLARSDQIQGFITSDKNM